MVMSAWSASILVTGFLLLQLAQTSDDVYHEPLRISKRAAAKNEKQDWVKIAQDDIKQTLEKPLIVNSAKNVILFLGDGYGISTMTATRILKGQRKGNSGEEEQLAFEKFPFTGLSKTYNVNAQTPDSAATATAYLCGVKANFFTLGVNENVTNKVCSPVTGNEVDSILKWSEREGKSVGFVTTTEITHATPAAAYAHSPDRWTAYQVPANSSGCEDIASQFFKYGKDFQVAMGGGRSHFTPTSRNDEVKSTPGKRTDGRDIIKEWQDYHNKLKHKANYVWNKQDLLGLKAAETDYILGLFASGHINYYDALEKEEPRLIDMMQKAIEVLQKNPKGYFLLVEGGRIDHGHHEGTATRALVEALEFDDAVAKARALTSELDTLLVVTADHSHPLIMGGYSNRGRPILDKVSHMNATDGKPYTTLLYGNGPGFSRTNKTSRRDITGVKTDDITYHQEAAIPTFITTHAGEDVAIFAQGPMSHLFSGVHEQHYIAHAMAYASCVGINKDHCSKSRTPIPCVGCTTSTGHSLLQSLPALIVILMTAHLLYL